MASASTSQIVAKLNLKPHPEGGFFTETFRDFSVKLSKSHLPSQSTMNRGNQQNQPGAVLQVDPVEFQNMQQAFLTLTQIMHNTHNGADNFMSKVAELRPDFFYGTDDPVVLEKWIRDFEKALDSVCCPEGRRVEVAVYYFKKQADDWWSASREELLAQQGFGWTQLKAAMREMFYPDHIKDRKFKEFLDLKQGTDSIYDYHKKFIELMKFGAELVPNEAKKVKRFLGGLNFQVRQTIGVTRFATLNEAHGAAQDVQQIFDENLEESRKRKSEAPATSNVQNRGNGNNGGDKRPRPNPYPNNFNGNHNHGGPILIHNCKGCGNNHSGRDCIGNKITCFNCGKLGHRKSECRTRPTGMNNNGNNFNPRGNYNGGGNVGNGANCSGWNNNNNRGGNNNQRNNYQQGGGYNNGGYNQGRNNNSYNQGRNNNVGDFNRGNNWQRGNGYNNQQQRNNPVTTTNAAATTATQAPATTARTGTINFMNPTQAEHANDATDKVDRPVSTSIYFLLPSGSVSHLHRIPCAETWHFYMGDPLTVFELDEKDGSVKLTRLGPNPLAENEHLQYTVKPNVWFGAFPTQDIEASTEGGPAVKAAPRDAERQFSLVGCTCAPAFQFEDFEMAKRSVLISLFPKHESLINLLTFAE